jgi:NADPH:quinone reductase
VRLRLPAWLARRGCGIKNFKAAPAKASGVDLIFFGSFVLGRQASPLSDLPLQSSARDGSAGRYIAKPPRIFSTTCQLRY